ncbi:Panacea domain-containing protein [Telmatospirillum sp. J64-1]|uniref:Panacea domain-containing protein n=1 Tax=Telmatospirillum sp. J64-1 TaxID=2502183 RepID=UPI00115DA607|nr:type II toxin-antitoxin system antitoxin SocA domain-containing protein [Telmatospirillum sp. J64-1]
MAAAAVESVFDVAYWFIDRALEDNEYLQPQKMQRLLYLAQAYFAVAHHGRPLMPATFVALEVGPVEPNVYRAFELGRPPMEVRPMAENVRHFLDSIWRRFGSHSADHLTRVLCNHPPFATAFAKGPRSEIPLASLAQFYGAPQLAKSQAAPPLKQVLRPRVMRSQSGKPVNVHAWVPSKTVVKK